MCVINVYTYLSEEQWLWVWLGGAREREVRL